MPADNRWSRLGHGNFRTLDADHVGGDSSMLRSWHGQGGAGSSGDLQEVATIHVRFQHGLLLFSLGAADVYVSGFNSR